MKKHFIAICSLLCIIMMVCSVLTYAVSAAPDSCSLTVEYTDEEAGALDGCEFRLYFIADGDLNEYTLAENFAEMEADAENVDWSIGEDVSNLADALSAYIANNEIAPVQKGSTDQEGRVTFAELPSGLYLALGDQVSKDGWIYTPQPILLWIPCTNPDGGLDYAPVCSPKHSKEPEIVWIEITVEKIWVDDGKHPSLVTVQLLCDGDVYDQVTLNDQNGWRYAWEALDSAHDWQIAEKDIPDGYTARVTNKGTAFTVTNTKRLPQTGQLWWPVPVLLGAGLLLVLFGLILRKFGKKGVPADGDPNGET